MDDLTRKMTTRVTRKVQVEFNVEQLEGMLRESCGFDSTATVEWDASDFYVRGVVVTSETTEQS